MRVFVPAALVGSILGCGTHLFPQPDAAKDYLPYAAFESPDHLGLLLHWPERSMPLRVYLPPPPQGWFADPDAVVEATRHAVTDWTDAAGPGLPRFVFVERPGDAEIPIIWEAKAPSSSFAGVAHCSFRIDFPTRRFGVESVGITAWDGDGTQVSVEDLHRTLLHEMGHALGIADHSPNPEDIMYPWVRDMKPGSVGEGWVLPSKSRGLTERDRETLRKLYAKPSGTVLAGVRKMY